MRIQYLGHACFRLISDGFGHTIITDPYSEQIVGEQMPELSADLVTVSHKHADHDYVQGVKGDPAVIDCEIVGNYDDVSISSIKTYHDAEQGKKRGENLVFLFKIDGITVAHLGDLGEINKELVEKLKDVDVLLIPVGGNYTIDSLQAKWYVDEIQPKIAIPMHYKRGTVKIDVAPPEDFYDLFDFSQVHFLSDTATIFDFEGYDEYAPTKIYVMEKYED